MSEVDAAMAAVIHEDTARRVAVMESLAELLTVDGQRPSEDYLIHVFFHIPWFTHPDFELDVDDLPMTV